MRDVIKLILGSFILTFHFLLILGQILIENNIVWARIKADPKIDNRVD